MTENPHHSFNYFVVYITSFLAYQIIKYIKNVFLQLEMNSMNNAQCSLCSEPASGTTSVAKTLPDGPILK